jgi:hypothetical protein
MTEAPKRRRVIYGLCDEAILASGDPRIAGREESRPITVRSGSCDL